MARAEGAGHQSKRLRQKIEPNPKHPQYVITAHGLGYKFAG